MKERIFVLDGARGIAAFCVLLFHLAAPTLKVFENFYIAVDFFFVLSGFVLADSITLIRTRENLKTFLVARYFRIAPMLLSVLSFYLAYDFFFIVRSSIMKLGEPSLILLEPLTILFSITFLQIFYQPALLVLFPAWSISAEWIVNVIFPLFLKLKKKGVLLCLMLGALMIEISEFFGVAAIGHLGRALWGFTLGFVAFRFRDLIDISDFQLMFTLLLLILFGMFAPKMAQHQFVFSGLLFSVIVMGISHKKLGRRANTVAKFLGEYSYGFYLWHFPILLTVGEFLNRSLSFNSVVINLQLTALGLLTVVLTLLATNLSIRFIERPMRSWANVRFNLSRR